MLGRLEFVSGGRSRRELAKLYGLDVVRVQTDPEGWLGKYRLKRAGSTLRRWAVGRVLVPEGFSDWEILSRFGLRGVDPTPFLHFCAPGLAVEGLRRRDVDPARATVALSGGRADAAMTAAALRLCPQVRRLVIAAPGGERLALRLRKEFGIPVLPPEEPAHMQVQFHPARRREEGACLKLYGSHPDLDGGGISFSGLETWEKEDIFLLCALWEGGKLDTDRLEFT